MTRNRQGVVGLLLLCALTLARPVLSDAQETPNLTGQFLVATPEMGDPRFAETVIFMTEHNEKGAMGLIINRPLAKGPIADLLKGLGVENEEATGEIILHYGGPVEPQKAFVLHSDDYVSDRTTIVGGTALTTDVEIVRALGRGKGPRRSIFLLGYAGWARGQLEGEIEAGAWFSIPADQRLIFEGDAEIKWEQALARRKVKT